MTTGAFSITYTLRDSAGFYAALLSKYSIDPSGIVFSNTTVATTCSQTSYTWNLIPCYVNTISYIGIPQAAPNFTPTNPKDIVTSALPQISSIQDDIMARQIDVASNTWGNDTDDVVETISMPVFMISQAVQAMGSVKDIGEQQKKEDQLKLVLLILGIVFTLIPFLDEVGPFLGIADGVFEIAAAAGNIGLAIQGIVNDPSSAPMEILSALTLGKSRTTEDFAGLAAAKRALTSEDLSSIGTSFKAAEDKLANTLKRGCFSKG
jgi:glucan 1,3-beta-glucosidase